MIEILNIRNSAKFPIIDFKFKNKGRSTALIRQFLVHVKTYTIDNSPVIRSFLSIPEYDILFDRETCEGKSLCLDLQNDGWGAANNLCIYLTSPLNELFPTYATSGSYSIASGAGERNAVELAISNLNDKEFSRCLQGIRANKEGCNSFSLEATRDKNSIYIHHLEFDISFQDSSSKIHQESIRPNNGMLPGNFGGCLSVKRDRFFWKGNYMVSCMSMPSAIYYISIDENQTGISKKYPIAHKCSTGDIEHFSIMIGSEKSCRSEIQFEFLTDEDVSLQSEWFELHIWNPRNKEYHNHYINGDELISRQRLVQHRKMSPRMELYSSLPTGFPFLTKEDGNGSCAISF